MPRLSVSQWNQVRVLYEEALKPVSELAKDFGLTDVAIRKMAKKEGWSRGAQTIVRDMAHDLADTAGLPSPDIAAEDRTGALAELGATVLVSHRKDIRIMRDVTRGLVSELQQLNEAKAQYEAAIEKVYEQLILQSGSPQKAAALKREMYFAINAISLGNRSKTLLNLVSSSKSLIELERQAYRLDESRDGKSYEELLREIHSQQNAPPQAEGVVA